MYIKSQTEIRIVSQLPRMPFMLKFVTHTIFFSKFTTKKIIFVEFIYYFLYFTVHRGAFELGIRIGLSTPNVPNESLLEKYLGMSSVVGNSKNGSFKFPRAVFGTKSKDGWLNCYLLGARRSLHCSTGIFHVLL
jgi:hypothetical protein